MDHLASPADPYQPIVIPYLESKYKFDGGAVITFPGRCGKKLADFLSDREQFLDRRSLAEVRAFLEEENAEQTEGWKTKHHDVFERLIRAISVVSDALNAIVATSGENSLLPDQNNSEYEKSPFWIDHNLAQAFDYLQRKIEEDVDQEMRQLVSYVWKLVLQNLLFLAPKGQTADNQDEDAENETLASKISEVSLGPKVTESLSELGVLSADFCKLVLETLHELHPDEVPDLEGQLESNDSDSNLAILQQWLFFGTIQKTFEIAEIPIDIQRYISSTDDDEPVLTTKYLKEDMKNWETIESNGSDGKGARRQQSMTETLVDVVMFAVNITDRAASSKIADFLTVVHSLCVTLEIKASQIYGGATGVLGTRNSWLGSKLVLAGWCPRQAEIMLDTYMLPVVYYVYLLGPPMKPHDRTGCSKWKCQLDNLQEYETLHSDLCTDMKLCKMLKANRSDTSGVRGNPYSPDIEKLISIVESGKIPILSFGHPLYDSMATLDMELEEFDLENPVRYVAISHVWSDGMGNAKSNHLPLCQLQNLRMMARNILGDGQVSRIYIWIDTLCVPVSSASARKAAILTMRKVYEYATVTLVLDSELLQHKLPPAPLEALSRIMNSRWCRRLWTFQEAALAHNLFFQFKGDCIGMSGIYEALKPSKKNPIFDPWGQFKVGWWPPMREYRNNAKLLHQYMTDPELLAMFSDEQIQEYKAIAADYDKFDNSFSMVWTSINLRNTQKSEDEVICVATLLELDLSALLATPIPDRRKKLFLLQKKVPSNMIFSRTRRLLEDGFRWAPRSFMGKAFVRSHQVNDAIVQEEGLLVTFPGLLFKGNKVKISSDNMDYQFLYNPRPEDKDSRAFPFAFTLGSKRLEQSEGEVEMDDWERFDASTYAIILSEPLVSLGGSGEEGVHRMVAALTSVYAEDQESGSIKVRYIEQVLVSRGIYKETFSSSQEETKSQLKTPNETGPLPSHPEEDHGPPHISQMKKRTTWERTFGAIAGTKSMKKTTLANPITLSAGQKWIVG